jgi:hypothetical protein
VKPVKGLDPRGPEVLSPLVRAVIFPDPPPNSLF